MSINLSMTCPNCGTQVEGTLTSLDANQTIDCPNCGAAVVYDPQKVEHGLENVADAIDKVKEKLKILG